MMDMRRKVVSTDILYSNKIFNLKIQKISMGKRILSRALIEHPGSVAIVPFIDESCIVIIRQYRYPIKNDLIELPAGTLEGNEKPIECAKRELEEETGYTARNICEIGSLYLAPGYSNELIHIFIADNLHFKGQHTDFDEMIRVEKKDIYILLEEIKRNQFGCDAKTVCGLYFAINHLQIHGNKRWNAK
jgi:ADP-ribose pyrophosphatase